MRSFTVQQSVAFQRLDNSKLRLPESAPNMEVWKADSSKFVDADMRKFFNEVVVVKIDAKSDTWDRLSKSEGQQAIALGLAASSFKGAPNHTHVKMSQEALRSFTRARKKSVKINKHLLALDIGNESNSAYLIRSRQKHAQNFAFISFGLSQHGRDEVLSWKDSASKLEKTLQIQGRYESVSVLGDPIKRATYIRDPDDSAQCVRRRSDNSMNSSGSSSDYENPRNSQYDYEYERWSEGTQTTIVPGRNGSNACPIEEEEPMCPPRRRRRRLDENNDDDSYSSSSSSTRSYSSSSHSSSSSSSSYQNDNDDDAMAIPDEEYMYASASSSLKATATPPASEMKCHSCGKKRTSNKHVNCHHCRKSNGRPVRCHHHSYHHGCSYCRWRRAQAPDGYETRIAALREQGMKDKLAYMAKVSEITARKVEKVGYSIRPGGAVPESRESHRSSCHSCGRTDDGCRGGYCPVKRDSTCPTPCDKEPSCPTPCKTEPSCPTPCKPKPACPTPCDPKPSCQTTCPPKAPECYYFIEDDTSSSSDDFCKLIGEEGPSTSSEEEEDGPAELFGVETLTETGSQFDAMDNEEKELHRFAESVMQDGQEMAFLWGGKKKLVVKMLDPVFADDTVADLNGDPSYTARLALQMAKAPGKAPDLDVATVTNSGSVANTARVQMFSKREGKGIVTRLKNLFAAPIMNRRLNERLAPVRFQSGELARGVRVFENLNVATSSSRVPTKAKFLEKKKVVGSQGSQGVSYTGSSFQMNVQFPTGENKQEMYFLKMDTDTASRARGSARRVGSAIGGNVWYLPESKTRAGIIMQFSRNADPSRSVLKSMYIVYSRSSMTERNYIDVFERADGANDSDAIDADGDGEFDIASASE